MKRAFLAGAALLAGTSLAAAEVIDGHWAMSLASCTAEFTDDILIVDVEVEGGFGYYESFCAITAWKALGGEYSSAWAAQFNCGGEGETWTTTAVIGLFQPFDGSPDQLAIIDTVDGWTTIWQRCPD